MTGNNWDEIDDEAMEEMARMFEQMGMPVDIDTLRSMIKQVRSQFEEMGIDPEKMSMSEVKLGLNSDSEDFMKNFESMISGPQGLGEFLKKMGVDIHIKAAESEVTVDVDENLNQKEDDSIPDNDVFVQGNKMSITIDISNYDDIESENIELSLTGGGGSPITKDKSNPTVQNICSTTHVRGRAPLGSKQWNSRYHIQARVALTKN